MAFAADAEMLGPMGFLSFPDESMTLVEGFRSHMTGFRDWNAPLILVLA